MEWSGAGAGGEGQRKEHTNGHRNPTQHRSREAPSSDQDVGWEKYKGKHKRKMESKAKKLWLPKIYATTMFISNLPEGTKEGTLWKNFEVYGEIQSVTIPPKRDMHGNFFGFVRYLNVSDKQDLLQKLKDTTITIDGAKIGINLAKYDRFTPDYFQPQSLNQPQQPEIYKPSNKTHHRQNNHQQNHFIPNKSPSFKETLINGQFPKSSNRTIILNPSEKEAGKIWSSVSLVAEFKDVKKLNECFSFLKSIGLKDFALRYVGALDVLITFKSNDKATTALSIVKEKWQTHIRNWFPWSEDYAPSDCLAWIIIRGVPPYLCDAETYDLIGNSLGSIVHKSSVSLDDGCLSYDRIGILTTQTGIIHDSISIRWRNKSYKVMVTIDCSIWFLISCFHPYRNVQTKLLPHRRQILRCRNPKTNRHALMWN